MKMKSMVDKITDIDSLAGEEIARLLKGIDVAVENLTGHINEIKRQNDELFQILKEGSSL
jgi:hypothetical protein